MQRGEIIAVGSELLLGGRLETNSLFLTEHLGLSGVEVRFKSVVGDDEADIVVAIRTAAHRADVIVLTGGLGPTGDDCTRQAIALATGRPLRRRSEALTMLRRRLAAWGRRPTRAHLSQALIPAGADVLTNPVGSAAGFSLEWKGRLLVALPGVPIEAEQMFAQEVVQRLATGATSCERIDRRILQTCGLPESDLERRLRGIVRKGDPVRLGFLPSPLGVAVTLTACGTAAEGPRGPKRGTSEALDRLVRAMRQRIGFSVFAEGAETMEEVVGRHLFRRRLTLAVAESCTGGLIGHRLTEVPGSSQYLDRVVVSYSDRAKTQLLGVPDDLIRRHGAVSAEVASAMARGIRVRSRTSIGLSVTGIAGPGGGTVEKPVGLVYIGLDTEGHRLPETRQFRFHGNRQTIKMRASQTTLNLLRLWLVRTDAQGSS